MLFSAPGTPCAPNDPICNDTNGVAHLAPGVREVMQQVSARFGISPYIALAGIAGTLFAAKWVRSYRNNPSQTPWQSLMTMIKNEFGQYAKPIQDKLNDLLAILNGEFKIQVLADQPFLNQDGQIFADMLEAGIQSKINKILPGLVTQLFSEKTLVEQNAAQASVSVASTDGTAELANGAFTDGLKNILRRFIDEAPRVPTEIAAPAESTTRKTKDGRTVYVDKDGSLSMDFRDAHRIPGSMMAPCVMVPVDKNYQPTKISTFRL